jgi:hypothetical protein
MTSTEAQISALRVAYVELVKKLNKDCQLDRMQLATVLDSRATGDCKNNQETAAYLQALAKELRL